MEMGLKKVAAVVMPAEQTIRHQLRRGSRKLSQKVQDLKGLDKSGRSSTVKNKRVMVVKRHNKPLVSLIKRRIANKYSREILELIKV